MIRWLEKRRQFSIALTILIAVEIFFFSSISALDPAPTGKISLAIIYHFCVFFLLNFFLMISLNGSKKIKIKYVIISLALSVVYSVLDEIHQIFVPNRYADIKDIMTNNAGIFLSTLIYIYSKNREN